MALQNYNVKCYFYYCSHIALRQDHYECSLLFLMRRARLDLRNKNDQLPVDCISVKNPKCATIIKLSTTLNDLMKDTPKYPLERIVCNDLTRGKENNPIQIVNDLDEAQEPHDYVYVKQNVVTTHVPIDRNISTLQVCIFNIGLLQIATEYETYLKNPLKPSNFPERSTWLESMCDVSLASAASVPHQQVSKSAKQHIE